GLAQPHARARRGDVRPGVRQPRPGRRAAGRAGRRPPAAAGSVSHQHAHAVRAGGRHPAGQLEGVADNYIEGYHIPIAHPGLMRMLDYKHYDVEVNEHFLWFDAPMRDKPSSNRLERLYSQLVTPM